MRETKQLHASSRKSPLPSTQLFPHRLPAAPSSPLRWPAAKSLGTIPPCIQESNQPHQIFSGIVTFIGVTYPTVWLAHWRLPSSRLSSVVKKFQPKSEVYSHSAQDLHGSLLLPEGCS